MDWKLLVVSNLKGVTFLVGHGFLEGNVPLLWDVNLFYPLYLSFVSRVVDKVRKAAAALISLWVLT